MWSIQLCQLIFKQSLSEPSVSLQNLSSSHQPDQPWILCCFFFCTIVTDPSQCLRYSPFLQFSFFSRSPTRTPYRTSSEAEACQQGSSRTTWNPTIWTRGGVWRCTWRDPAWPSSRTESTLRGWSRPTSVTVGSSEWRVWLRRIYFYGFRLRTSLSTIPIPVSFCLTLVLLTSSFLFLSLKILLFVNLKVLFLSSFSIFGLWFCSGSEPPCLFVALFTGSPLFSVWLLRN